MRYLVEITGDEIEFRKLQRYAFNYGYRWRDTGKELEKGRRGFGRYIHFLTNGKTMIFSESRPTEWHILLKRGMFIKRLKAGTL